MQPIGSYSPAIKAGNLVFLSGQIPLDPKTMQLCSEHIESQVDQVFRNLQDLCEHNGGSLHKIVKLTVYLINLDDVKLVNEAIQKFWDNKNYPARSVIGINALPRESLIEVEAIMVI
jgi:reactive intermediate/imine deaminase